MKKLMLTKSVKLSLFSVLFVAACAKTILIWQAPLLDSPSFSILYPSNDDFGFYRVAHFSESGITELSGYDLEGNILQTRSFSDLNLTPEMKAQPVGATGAFLLDENASNLKDSIAYLSTDSSAVWQGLPTDWLAPGETFWVRTAFVAGERIMFYAVLVDSNGLDKEIIGSVSTDRSVNTVIYEDLSYLDFFHIRASDSLVVVGNYKEEIANAQGLEGQSFIQRLDYSLNQQYYVKQDFTFEADMATDTRLQGSMVVNDQVIYGLIDYEGNFLGTTVQDNPYDNRDYLWAKDVFYRIEEKRVTLGTESNYLYADGYEICQFDNDFILQWCELTELGLLMQPYTAQIVNENDIGITYQTKTWMPDVAGLSIEQIEQQVLAGFDVWVLESWRVHHSLYSKQGTKVLNAEPKPYSHIGKYRFCSNYNNDALCLIDKEYTPGHAYFVSAAFLPGERVIAETISQEQYVNYEGFVGEGVNYLSYWETER